MSLDHVTRRKIRDFIRTDRGSVLSAHQVAVQFRLPADLEPDIAGIMTETAITDSGPPQRKLEVLTPPAEVLDQLVHETAAAPSEVRVFLICCEMCRNHLLYLLDTSPYTDEPEAQIRARLQALPEVHKAHGANGPDRDAPRIRWITP